MGERDATGNTFVTRLSARQLEIWIAGLVLYGIGDIATTVLGLRLSTVDEAGPLAVSLIGTLGLPGLLALKLGTILLFVVAWRSIETSGRIAVPLALAVVGGAVTVWNLVVIATA